MLQICEMLRKKRPLRYLTALCTGMLLLAGCGGSGGGSDSAAPPRPADLTGAPTADAGPDQGVTLSDTGGAVDVTLDGSASTDPDGDALVYVWAMLSKPPGSQAKLSSPLAPQPTFKADLRGSYVFALVVNDGRYHSVEDTVTVTAAPGNSMPFANAGPDQTVAVGQEVTLDGSDSHDPDDDRLNYSWNLDYYFKVPGSDATSTASLSDPAAARPTFIPEVAGKFLFSLTVSDDELTSERDYVFITVSSTASSSAVTTQGVVTAQPVLPAEPLLLEASTLDNKEFLASSLRDEDDDYVFAAQRQSGIYNGAQSFTWQIIDGRELEILFADGRRHLLYLTRRGFDPPACEIVRLLIEPSGILSSDVGFWQLD